MSFDFEKFGFKRNGKEELAQTLCKNGCKLNADGVAICRKCNTPKMWYYNYTDSWFPIACKHELEEDKQEKDDTAIERYRATSGIEGRLAEASFNNFGITNGNREAYTRSLQYAGNIEKIMPKGYGIYYFGKSGVGKTYIAACLGNMLLDMGVEVKFAKVSDILTDIKEAYSQRGNETAVLNEYIYADVVILDDIGSEDYTARRGVAVSFAQEKLFQLIDGRYEKRKPTIFTSNYSLEELITKRGILRKTVERIMEMSTRKFEIIGDSFRITKQINITEF